MIFIIARAQLPNETLSIIAEMLVLDFEPATNIKSFILTCKRAQEIGDRLLYRSVLLGRMSDIECFTFFARLITKGKARFVKTLEIPDSFPIQTSSLHALMGQSFLKSLFNLEELIILQQCEIPFFHMDLPLSVAAPVVVHANQSSTIFTPPNTTFWSPSMFTELPFQLEQLVGTFSNPETTAALFSAQPLIRRWASTGDLPMQMLEWTMPALKAICFTVGSLIHNSSIRETMSIADMPSRSKLERLSVRGLEKADLIGDAGLLSFSNVTTLSIEMLKFPNMSQHGMLTDIMKYAPKLSHLTFMTLGKGVRATGVRRQNQMVRFVLSSIFPH